MYNIRLRNQLYKTLQILENFDVDEPIKVVFEKSPFPIFNELNDYLLELIKRIRLNYKANKQFTENASHELQTPLAIIKGNSELLIQSDKLGEKELNALSAIISNTNRLSKLNTALILLSKIEHQRFVDKEIVMVENVVSEVLENFKDVIKLQNIQIKRSKPETIQFEMSATLAEIAIANLIQNAIRHNINNGFIEISQLGNILLIANSGKPLTIPKKDLFKRFRRDSDIEESLGLGLSIVHRICKQYHIDIDYFFEKGIHNFKLTFPIN
jgi:signal transduction histidine kinase